VAQTADDVGIFLPLVFGLLTTAATIIVHALAFIAVVRYILYEEKLGRVGASFWRDAAITSVATLVVLGAHLIEIATWAIVLLACGEFQNMASGFYHSAVNYTSLGLDNVIMSSAWKLMAPLETADGMLMFGVSTALIFAIVQRLLKARLL
jgi:hypothetical protein